MTERQYEAGTVVEVAEYVYGDELAADTAAGATTLVLADVTDFSDWAGGRATVGTETVTYTATDYDANLLLLAAPTTLAHAAADRVLVYPDTRERLAMVRLDTDGEAVEARVPHALYDRVPEGTRDDGTGESVSLYLDGTEWVLEDVLGLQPIIDGSYIDPTTLPPPAPSDGLPPTGAITLTVSPLGIGSLQAHWTVLVNADPVSYTVHISPTQGFTPGPTTQVGVVVAQESLTIGQLPDGTPLAYGTTYYLRVIAGDADGVGPTSNEASAQTRQATDTDLDANTVYAIKVAAEGIQTGDLQADLATLGTIRTAKQGQRVEMSGSAGIVNYGPDGSPRVILPTGGDTPAMLRGTAEVDSLTVHGQAQLQGGAEITRGQDLVLDSKVQGPIVAPSLTKTYVELPLVTDPVAAPAASRFGLVYSAGTWWTAQVHYGTATDDPLVGTDLRSFSATDGSVTGVLTLAGASAATGTQADVLYATGGVTQLGGSWYVLGQAVDASWWVRVYDATGTELRRFAFRQAPNGGQPAIGSATIASVAQVLVARVDGSGQLFVYSYTPTTGALLATLACASPGAVDCAGVMWGQFDLSTTRYMVAFLSQKLNLQRVWALNDTTGAYDPVRAFPNGRAAVQGLAWDGTRFATLRQGLGAVRYYTNASQGLNGDTYSLGAETTFHDSTQGYATVPGPPVVDATIFKRQAFILAASDTPLGVNSVKFHISVSGAPYAPCTTQPAVGVLVATYTDVTTSGTTPTSNTFPATSSARVVSAGMPMLAGDSYGTFATGDIKPTARAAAGAGTPIQAGGTWLLCDGSAVSRVVFSALYVALGGSGSPWGQGDGSTTFNVPDLRSRMIRGTGANAVLGGSDNLPDDGSRQVRHTHPISGNTHNHGAGSLVNSSTSLNQATNTVATGGANRLTAPDSHTHTITGQTNNDTHDHGAAAGLNAANSVPNIALNFLIKT